MKIKEDFEVLYFLTKRFLNSRYEYANEWVDDVIASLFAIYLVYTMNFSYFVRSSM